jgi:hypothetical protein
MEQQQPAAGRGIDLTPPSAPYMWGAAKNYMRNCTRKRQGQSARRWTGQRKEKRNWIKQHPEKRNENNAV